MKTLDIEAVQAFVLAADLNSFTRAAEAMDSTQSAVSIKIRRLEEGLTRRLLERTPRRVRLTDDGALFLPAARLLVQAHQGALGAFGATGTGGRRLTVGISHHLIGVELPRLLKHMHDAEPELAMEVRIGPSHELVGAFDNGNLDAAIVLRQDNQRKDGEVILKEKFGWMAAPDFDCRRGQPLRLAAQAAPCPVRSAALAALDAAGIAWTEVFVGGGTAVGAAVAAGLAVAALGRRVAPLHCKDIGSKLGLPALPSRDVVMYSSASGQAARQSLRSLAAAIRSTAA